MNKTQNIKMKKRNQVVKPKPAEGVVEEAPVNTVVEPVTESTAEETKLPPVIKVAADEGIKQTSQYSQVYVECRDAFLFKVKQMEDLFGPGKVFDQKVAAGQQIELCRIVTNFISKVPNEEVRKCIGFILDTYNTSEFLAPRCVFKGMVQKGKPVTPEWFTTLTTLFTMTANPETRFKIVGKTFDISKMDGKMPPIMETRIKEFFKV